MPNTYTPYPSAPQIGFVPMPAVARILSSFDRKSLNAFIAVAIELADLADGDPDFETNDAEDEFLTTWALRYARSGPGCDVTDAGEDEHDREAIDEREPSEDGHVCHSGINQAAPISDSNPAVL